MKNNTSPINSRLETKGTLFWVVTSELSVYRNKFTLPDYSINKNLNTCTQTCRLICSLQVLYLKKSQKYLTVCFLKVYQMCRLSRPVWIGIFSRKFSLWVPYLTLIFYTPTKHYNKTWNIVYTIYLTYKFKQVTVKFSWSSTFGLNASCILANSWVLSTCVQKQICYRSLTSSIFLHNINTHHVLRYGNTLKIIFKST